MSRKARLLFAYLASQPERGVAREVLSERFWGDCPASRGPNNLSIAVFQIRTWLKGIAGSADGGITVQRGVYALARGAWSVDAVEFSQLIARGRAAIAGGDGAAARDCMQAAVELYRGDYLQSDLYEEWTIAPRRAYASQMARALNWLAEDAARSEDWHAVLQRAERMIELDDCDEAAHRWLMVANWRLGRSSHALALFRALCERLESELGVAPAKQTQDLYRLISGHAS